MIAYLLNFSTASERVTYVIFLSTLKINKTKFMLSDLALNLLDFHLDSF